MMKKQRVIIAVIVIIGIPIILNYILQCPSPLNFIIGGGNASHVWLNFWASYSGAVISTFASLFILYKTLSQNHEENEKNRVSDNKKFIYEQKKKDLDSLIKNLTTYLSCFDTNNFTKIYNKCRRTKDYESCIDDIGDLFNKSFIALEKVSLHFTSKELKTDDLNWLSKDYMSLMKLLNNFQYFIAEREKWENIESTKKQFDALLKSYSYIKPELIETKARKYLERKRTEIENIMQY